MSTTHDCSGLPTSRGKRSLRFHGEWTSGLRRASSTSSRRNDAGTSAGGSNGINEATCIIVSGRSP